MTGDGPHLPRRPLWLCRGCAVAWPCAAARASLVIEYADNLVGLSVYLCSALYDATADLRILNQDDQPTPRDLYSRFISWVPR